MLIIKNGSEVDLASRVAFYKEHLTPDSVYTLTSTDHVDHIAAYIAWRDRGGNIFVKSPTLPPEQSESLDQQVKNLEPAQPSVYFHTSGTTGIPKIITHTPKQFDQAVRMNTNALRWNDQTRFLNFIPSSTSGFWHIAIPSTVHYSSTLMLGSKESIASDFDTDANLTVLVPALIDQLRARGVRIDLSRMEGVGCGASQVLPRHAEWCFDNGARIFDHIYGCTETCSPILHHSTLPGAVGAEYLDLTPISHSEFKIVDDELWVKGESLYEGADEWHATHDLWDVVDGKIKFKGRKNDVVKMNGYQCNLLLLENTLESRTDLGEAIAVVRETLGVEWIEAFYTNPHANVIKSNIADSIKSIIPQTSIPLKYTFVDQLPRNSYGKKMRHVLSTNT